MYRGKFGFVLEPTSDPAACWPSPPPGLAQINIEFVEPSMRSTARADSGVLLATVALQAIPGVFAAVSPFELGFDHPGNRFVVGGVDVSGDVEVFTPHDFIYVSPEPGTALLVGVGLFGLGAAARRRPQLAA